MDGGDGGSTDADGGKGGGKGAGGGLSFDVETAISVLRGAGCLNEALYLAKQHRRHAWYVRIQVEDAHDFDAALEYIRRLPFLAAETNMTKYV